MAAEKSPWKLLVLFSLVLLPAVVSAENYQVSDVVFEGNKRVADDSLRLQLAKTSGTFTPEEISDSIKKIYETGFFDQVSASIIRKDGRPYLRLALAEKPLVRRVFVKGNKEVEESDLKDILTFGDRRFLDKVSVLAIEKKALNYYQSRGFYDASMDYTAAPAGNNMVDITFTVNEGDRYKIREIGFTGLHELDESDLRSAIETKRYKWWSSWLFGTGRLSPEMLENDKKLLRQYFLDHGLVEGSVSDPAIEKRDKGLYITFDVNEGRLFHLGTVAAAGDLIDNQQEPTLEGIEVKSGEVFSAEKLRKSSFAISDKFSNRGYAFVNVAPDTRINREEATVDVGFTIDKGPLVTINKIRIEGNEKTYDNVIRREMKIAEQELYAGDKIKRSQQMLERLGYFEEVNITTEPTDDKSKADLLVNVREAPTGSFSVGAGYSTSDGAIFNTRLAESNLFGSGRSANLDIDVGTQRNNIILSYDDRRFNDSYVAFGADVMRAERQFIDFDRTLTGGGVTFGYPLEQVFGEWAQDLSTSIKYEYLNIDISDVNPLSAAPLVVQSQGTSTSSGVTPQFVRSTINNPLNPTSGSQQVFSYEITGLGGDQEYYLLGARNTWYYPLIKTTTGRDLTLSWRIRYDYGKSLDDEPFPLFRRFFPGGINSVRGYKARSLGPKDENGNLFGGSKELINNLEVIFPILTAAGLRGVLFYDIGQAFDDRQSVDLSDLREAWGYGLRWTSPIGPLRIEFGYPIDRQPGEKGFVTLFSFGAPL